MFESDAAPLAPITLCGSVRASLAPVLFAIVLFLPTDGYARLSDDLWELIAAGAYDSALVMIDHELAGDSTQAFLWLQRDTILAAAGRTEARITSFERALAIWPHAAGFRLRLAEILIDRGRPAEARPHIEAALAQPSGQEIRGHYLAGRMYELAGVFDSAVVAYRRAWLLLHPRAAATQQ